MRDLLLAVVVFALLIWTIRQPWIGVLTWTWIGLMNPHRLAFGFMWSFPTAAVVAGVTLLSLVLHAKDNKAPPATAPVIWLTLLVVHFTVTTAFAWTPEAAWVQWEKVMKILLFTYVTMMLIHGQQKIRWLMIVVAGSIGFYSVKGAIFSLATGGQHTIWGPEGSFIDANTSIGLAFLMVWPLAIALGQDRERWVSWPFKAMAWLTPISVVFTYSRGALVGLAAMALPMWWAAKRKLLIILLLVPVALFAVWFTPDKLVDRAETIQTYQEDDSSMQRIQAWGVAWNVALSRPLTGSGFTLESLDRDTWASYAMFHSERWFTRPRAAHSNYFQMLGDHGFVGLFLFLGLLVSCFVSLARVRREAASTPGFEYLADYSKALMLGLIGYVVAGAFLSLAYFDLFYIFVAAAAIFQRELREAKKAAQSAAFSRPNKDQSSRLRELKPSRKS